MKSMKVLDLFSGSKSLKKPVEDMGWEYFSIDNVSEYNPDMVADILELKVEDIPFKPDIIWASPPCTFFSVASIGRHWNKDHTPKTESAEYGMSLVKHTIGLIEELNPKYWFMENPRGKLRKLYFMQDFTRRTVTYCQYGESRMKPTDIWTNNLKWIPRTMCKNGDPCHVSAPRGSQTGTQGMGSAYEKARVPHSLLDEVLLSCSE